MFLCDNNASERLPEVIIYGGDTTPWNFNIIQKNGNPYPYASLSSSTAVLSLAPYAISMGIGSDAEITEPELSIDGTIIDNGDGGAIAKFVFESDSTINLRGKYVYQVEIKTGGDKRILQGLLTIKQNINRKQA